MLLIEFGQLNSTKCRTLNEFQAKNQFRFTAKRQIAHVPMYVGMYIHLLTRVTRLGEFSSIGGFFSLGIFLKNYI
jgi:hypothetical protein